MHGAQARVDEHGAKLELSEDLHLRLDSEGRWGSFRKGRRFYRRTLRDEAWCRDRELGPEEHRLLLADIRNCLLATRREIRDRRLTILGRREELHELLDRALRLEEDPLDRRLQFDQAYAEPVPILPPDRYRDLVVLPATGCPNGQCSFCAFYKDIPFRVFSQDEFEEHLDRLEALLGRALQARDGLFLGSANALALPHKKLVPMLETLRTRIGPRRRGIASFFDPEHAPSRSAADWQQLATLGLTQVVLGLETADPGLRAALGKTPDLSLIDDSIQTIRQTPIRIGLTLLLGAGDAASADSQLDQACNFLTSLPLRSADLIYLSPLDDSSWPDAHSHFAPWRRTLGTATTAQLVHYSMDRFHYYA